MAASDYAIFYNDNAGDFAAGFREDILAKIGELEENLTEDGEYAESEQILYYLTILNTLVRHVPFEECVNEFVVLDVDYLRELKEKFMLVWEAQFVADIGGPENLAEGIDYETFVRDHRELVEKTFDDLIEASENPPPPLLH